MAYLFLLARLLAVISRPFLGRLLLLVHNASVKKRPVQKL